MLEDYKQALILALKDEEWQKREREQMIPYAREKYGWDKIARSWEEVFRK